MKCALRDPSRMSADGVRHVTRWRKGYFCGRPTSFCISFLQTPEILGQASDMKSVKDLCEAAGT